MTNFATKPCENLEILKDDMLDLKMNGVLVVEGLANGVEVINKIKIRLPASWWLLILNLASCIVKKQRYDNGFSCVKCIEFVGCYLLNLRKERIENDGENYKNKNVQKEYIERILSKFGGLQQVQKTFDDTLEAASKANNSDSPKFSDDLTAMVHYLKHRKEITKRMTTLVHYVKHWEEIVKRAVQNITADVYMEVARMVIGEDPKEVYMMVIGKDSKKVERIVNGEDPKEVYRMLMGEGPKEVYIMTIGKDSKKVDSHRVIEEDPKEVYRIVMGEDPKEVDRMVIGEDTDEFTLNIPHKWKNIVTFVRRIYAKDGSYQSFIKTCHCRSSKDK